MKITVDEEEDADEEDKQVCGDCNNNNDTTSGNTSSSAEKKNKSKKRKLSSKPPAPPPHPGSVHIECEDGSTFIFPRQDCLLLPIMHSTAEELAIYLYGKILAKLDAEYLHKRGVTVMEVTVSEAVGQDAIFRRAIPKPGSLQNEFDVASYITDAPIPAMPCGTDTEAANRRRTV